MIALIDYGAGNLRSVEFALDRLGVASLRASTPEATAGAEALILPGVGAADSAMRALERGGWPAALRAEERPLLGICLGFQLLFEWSEEGSARTTCLGLLPGTVRRFGWDRGTEGEAMSSPRLPVPHTGWSSTRFLVPDALFEGLDEPSWFYFVHGFRVECDAGIVTACADYGERFPAAVRRGNLAGVQFHPEKSGPAGAALLVNFCAGLGT